MVLGVDVGHRAAAGHDRHPVGEQLAPRHQHPGRRRAADELVRREEDRVLVGERVAGGRVHLDVDVGGGGGEVPERERAVLVQQRRDAVGVADDAGDVGGRAERADLQRAVGELGEPLAQVVEAHPAVGVLADDHDVGDRLAPGHLVRVVLVRADEHHRALVARDLLAQLPAVLEGRGDAQPEHPDQLVDRPGAPRPGEDHHGVVVAVHGVADDAARVLAQPGGLQAGSAALGVGVGVAGQHLVADEVLEEGQRPTGCRVVGVRDPAPPVGGGHHVVLTDDGLANAAHQRLLARLRCRALSHGHRVSRCAVKGSACMQVQVCTAVHIDVPSVG